MVNFALDHMSRERAEIPSISMGKAVLSELHPMLAVSEMLSEWHGVSFEPVDDDRVEVVMSPRAKGAFDRVKRRKEYIFVNSLLKNLPVGVSPNWDSEVVQRIKTRQITNDELKELLRPAVEWSLSKSRF